MELTEEEAKIIERLRAHPAAIMDAAEAMLDALINQLGVGEACRETTQEAGAHQHPQPLGPSR